MATNNMKIKTKIYHYLVANGPKTTAQLMYELKSPVRSPNKLSNILRVSYLFEVVDVVKQSRIGSGRYDANVWGALPLNIATLRYIDPPKHQIQPLSKQPLFVREYVEAIQNEVDE